MGIAQQSHQAGGEQQGQDQIAPEGEPEQVPVACQLHHEAVEQIDGQGVPAQLRDPGDGPPGYEQQQRKNPAEAEKGDQQPGVGAEVAGGVGDGPIEMCIRDSLYSGLPDPGGLCGHLVELAGELGL